MARWCVLVGRSSRRASARGQGGKGPGVTVCRKSVECMRLFLKNVMQRCGRAMDWFRARGRGPMHGLGTCNLAGSRTEVTAGPDHGAWPVQLHDFGQNRTNLHGPVQPLRFGLGELQLGLAALSCVALQGGRRDVLASYRSARCSNSGRRLSQSGAEPMPRADEHPIACRPK